MSEMRLTRFAVEIVLTLACLVIGWPAACTRTPPSFPVARAEPWKLAEGFAANEGPALTDGWRLVRIPDPYGDAAAISIMRTAEMPIMVFAACDNGRWMTAATIPGWPSHGVEAASHNEGK